MAIRSRTRKRSSHDGVLRLIAVFKFLKAATLIATGIGALKLVHADLGTLVQHWVAMLNLDPGGRLVNHAIQKVTNLSPHRIRELGIVSFIYAGLFLAEGTGLWLQKRWGEWLTIIITGSLVPVEIYETIHRPTALKGLVLLMNIAVVIYLIVRIKREPSS
ncbi:DUF2127 domain-containing protein [Occallatibacter savannae]|uniref:DUF2127 domain-containing protein n=1 Tax=Occallatibacter savannae TaxID=1002691 RepID=UPI000D69542B|nr:DUF2127 domain-containing protein [Occallatibacter savannae]